ncbi:hypothetical protein [Fulvivirga ligni]|uniref:hypothetical protein n=1 Tax=Fulvivirga ligni TaxID=2904246 RepID=UPI001F403D6D|nr:hypothetical protein [Fulvivirga ligni]UII24226.1 hypothetical protein LVD16_13475 [Fulvivirga ligni]
MTQNIGCGQSLLKDGSQLYYQFNCDSIWLTLETNDYQEIIFSGSQEFYAYHYRLDPHLVKEFSSALLFRYGCLANGPCSYFLIAKKDGTRTREFGQLIYDGTIYKASILVYISEKMDNTLEVYDVEQQKTVQIPFDLAGFTAVIPQQQFTKSEVNGDNLILTYKIFPNSNKEAEKVLMIDLDNY